jgi:hypothetical protein
VTAGRPPSRDALAAIESLARLSTTAEVVRALRAAANSIGTTRCVVALAPADSDSRANSFLVDFEQMQDAMTASRAWGCGQYGFTAVLVRLGDAGTQATARRVRH